MQRSGVCPVCKRRTILTRHHILKWNVFHNDNEDNIIYLCKKCHNNGKNCLEELIRERENAILRKYPELYTKALTDYINGVRPRQARSRRRKNGRKVLCV